MQSVSISNRVNLGFTLTTVILVCVCLVAYGAIQTLGDTFKDYRATAKQSIVINDFVEDIFQARVESLKYRLDPSQENKDGVTSNIAEITRDVESYRQTQTDPATLAQVEKLSELSNRYLNDFMQMSAKYNDVTTVNSLLLEQGRTVRATLTELRELAFDNGDLQLLNLQSTVQEALMLGRVYAEEYFSSEDVSYFDVSNEQFQTAAQLLNEARTTLSQGTATQWQDRATGLVDTAMTDLAKVQTGLADMKNSMEAYVTLRDDSLDQVGPLLQNSLENWVEAVVDRQNTLGPRGQSVVDQVKNWSPILGIAALAISVGAAFLISKWITVPVRNLAASTTALADGNVDVLIEGAEHKHELGQMAKALEVFRSAHIERERVLKEREEQVLAEQRGLVDALSNGLQSLASGHLDVRIDQHLGEDYETLRQNFNSALSQLESTMEGVVDSSTKIDQHAASISASSDDLSERTENQAAALEETAAALEELTASVRSSADNAKEVAATVGSTRANAKESGEVVGKAINAMSQIEDSSNQISQITSVIADIAFQTNLLALNAGVEAARAGDAGRGFAVVASEVRALAQRSTQATKEVSDLIANSSAHVATGTKLVNDAGTTLETVIEKIDHVSELVSNIASNAEEQASSVSEINIGVSQLDQVTQQNAAMVQDSNQKGTEMASEATGLQRLVSVFRVSNQPNEIAVFKARNNIEPMHAKSAPAMDFGEDAFDGAAAKKTEDWTDF